MALLCSNTAFPISHVDAHDIATHQDPSASVNVPLGSFSAALLCLQVESEAVAAADVLGAAKGLMVSQPDGLLQRLLGQVMDLLGVQQLEGLPATVNKVGGSM